MQVKGIITLKVLDSTTHEVLDEITQENIITETFGAAVFPGYKVYCPEFNLQVCLSTATVEPSYYPPVLPPSSAGFSTILRSGDVFGVPAKQLIEGTNSDPDIIQFSGRFNPPATGTTRTIRTVMLGFNNYLSNFSMNQSYINEPNMVAYSKLDTPCVQTDSQIYDIYYRIMVTYDENNIFNKTTMRALLKRSSLQSGWTSYSGDYAAYGYYKMFPDLVVPAVDKNTVQEMLGFNNDNEYDVSGWNSLYYLRDRTFTNSNSKNIINSPRPYSVRTHVLGFNDYVGLILNTQQYVYNTIYPINGHSNRIFNKQSKIQNLFGYNVVSNNINSHPFLDVDNLPTGTGSISVTGEWNNVEGYVNNDLYFKTKFPERNTINITTSGPVGASTYSYVKEKYIPVLPNGLSIDHPNTRPHRNIHATTPIFQLMSSDNWFALNKGVLGDISNTFFDVEQISASIAFDDSSIVIPKTNKVILYSVPASRYWFITGAFTNIHQLEVLNGSIYIACRNTGLWVCNPRVSLEATKVVISSPRTVDLSKCHGVSLGYNKLWVVANDALCSFNGTAWVVYDNTTTPAFGTSAAIFPRIGYLKPAIDSDTDQIFFVYNPADATTKVGFWWSPSTAILETSLIAGTTAQGYPKKNRQHVKTCKDFAYIWTAATIYRCPFNTTVATSVVTGYAGGYLSFELIDDVTKTDKLLAVFSGGQYSNYSSISNNNVNTKTYNKTSVLVDNIQSSTMFAPNQDYFGIGGISRDGRDDAYKTIINLNGAWMVIQKCTDLRFTANLMKPPFSTPTQNGGPLSYTFRDTYGWDGTQWVLGHTGSKVTHSTTEDLLDGVKVNFSNGASGTSFVLGNHYKFGLCEGLLKDNATRATHVTPEILVKSKKGLAPLSSNVVPVTATLPTGAVGIHLTHKSKSAFVDANGRVTFPGNTSGQFAIGDKHVTGDFHLTVTCTDIANTAIINRSVFGIGKRHKGPQPILGFVFTSSSSAAVVKSTNCFANDNVSPNAPSTIYNIYSLSASSIIGIRRIGSTVTITVNGSNVYTVDTIGLLSDIDKRLDVVFSTHFASIGNSYRSANTTCPVVNISSNGEDNVVYIGDPVQESEAYDIRCRRVVPELGATVTLDGVPATVRFTGTPPVPGEVCIDAESLLMFFNPADVGKTITVDCVRAWDM